jgi:hypothetical protein
MIRSCILCILWIYAYLSTQALFLYVENIQNLYCPVWWHTYLLSATQEAEAGGLQFEATMGNIARLHPQNNSIF